MDSPEGKQQAASAAAGDVLPGLGHLRPRLETGPVTTCGTPLDLGSSTATGTSAQDSGRSSLEPPTTDCSDTSRTEPGQAHTKVGRRRRQGGGAGVTRARRNTRQLGRDWDDNSRVRPERRCAVGYCMADDTTRTHLLRVVTSP
ncbi:hypothetical protein Q7P35_005555 [Cladosporium inversicolor]